MNRNKLLWQDYYQQTQNKPHHVRTQLAAELNKSGLNKAIDCGCGTGNDVRYLSQLGYQVSGFDVNEDSVALCRKRFAGDDSVHIAHSNFEQFEYSRCGVVIAHSSLYFSDPLYFVQTWQKISQSLQSRGVFSGDFLGIDDSWVLEGNHQTNPISRLQIEDLFSDFQIIQFDERNELGKTALGREKHWHTYSVVAVKN
ncbi:class I SAM-dependent methyltransferase [Vibrio tapetis]|uniref:SAM-dependent methyltransferase n=1 Tax=Vibrio tapetis subsp. tapetis TaxID=1671868 RepID=A0A2N8ZLY4_9VIBR|nr:class I SAM-dependent methyltransferase [Vibrio tapetis]SON52918.1 SAM-dependent methyltransferase [Vibrio tapetis subsp. tapetis]